MTSTDWLSQFHPAPPEDLVRAIQNALEGSRSDPGAEDLLRAAERVLEKILRSDCEARASAMDLLAIDALVTQALLVATRDRAAPQDFAEQAMVRVASLCR
jgi:hypothetical protein